MIDIKLTLVTKCISLLLFFAIYTSGSMASAQTEENSKHWVFLQYQNIEQGVFYEKFLECALCLANPSVGLGVETYYNEDFDLRAKTLVGSIDRSDDTESDIFVFSVGGSYKIPIPKKDLIFKIGLDAGIMRLQPSRKGLDWIGQFTIEGRSTLYYKRADNLSVFAEMSYLYGGRRQGGRSFSIGLSLAVKESDFDKDGVPDRKDDCPNEGGDKNNRGCPREN